ncbi:MAG TPA: hypothetical protein VE687_09575, partial [Stellaceae bacterium]|nr:hypothetical protein [Stellaceae bacterium]
MLSRIISRSAAKPVADLFKNARYAALEGSVGRKIGNASLGTAFGSDRRASNVQAFLSTTQAGTITEYIGEWHTPPGCQEPRVHD